MAPPLTAAAGRTGADSFDASGLSRKLAIVAAARIGFVTVSLGAVFALADHTQRLGPNASQLTLVIVAYVVSVVYALALRSSVSVLALAYAQVVVDAVLVTLLVMTTGGIESVFTFTYVFVVIGAAMTLYRRGTILAAGASLLCLATMAVLQVDNSVANLPAVEAPRAALSMFSYVISLVLVAGLAGTLAENVKAAGKRLAEAQSEFERLEELQAAILKSLPAGLVTLDAEGRIRYGNDAAQTILGVPFEQLYARWIGEVVPGMGESWQRLVASGATPTPRERYDAAHLRPNGVQLRLGFSFAPLSPRPEASSGLIVVFQDLTEIARLKEAFERAERLALVGKLAAGLAHEVRNPLSSMCASIDVLKDALAPPEAMKRLMDNVVREGDRLNRLITEFLTFARPREPVLRNTDLTQLTKELTEVFAAEAEQAHCEVVLFAEPGIFAEVDPDMIRQVLWNLVRNAAQAVRDKSGKVTVVTRRTSTAVEISVRDDGPGIAEEALPRIFDPFFTTKERGTGLGLAIAQSIALAHGGSILVSSEVGQGTEFVLHLPLHRPLLPAPSVQDLLTDPPRPAG